MPVVRRKTHSGNVRKQLHPFLRSYGVRGDSQTYFFSTEVRSSKASGSLFHHSHHKIMTLPKCFVTGPLDEN